MDLSNTDALVVKPSQKILHLDKFQYGNGYDNKSQRKRGVSTALLRQLVAATLASLSSVSIGFITAFSSQTLPQLRNDSSINYIDSRDSGWVVALPSISSIAGSLFGGFLMDAIGPRKCLLITAIPCILSWGFIVFANSMAMMYIGRFMTGIFLGIFSPVPQVYATEIAEANIRGMMGAFPEAAVALGSLLCYIFGAIMDWRYLAVTAALIPGVPLFLSMIVLPESPQWLTKKGKIVLTRKSLRFFRSKFYDVEEEANIIRHNLMQTAGTNISICDQLKLFKKSQNWKPIVIVFLTFMCGQFSGFAVVTAYTADIFSKSGANLDPNVSTIIVGTVRFFATLVSAVLLDRVGRKPLLIVSAIGSSLGMLSIGFFFYLQEFHSIENVRWLPLLSLIIYVLFNELGYGPIPWLLSGELIPLAVRTIGNGVAVTAYSLFAFIIGLTFPMLTDHLSIYTTFWIYAVCSLSGVFLGCYLPETKGKTLEEIEKLFIPKKK